jgi:hypothetical protein
MKGLEHERQQIELQMSRLKRWAQAPGRRLQHNDGGGHEF